MMGEIAMVALVPDLSSVALSVGASAGFAALITSCAGFLLARSQRRWQLQQEGQKEIREAQDREAGRLRANLVLMVSSMINLVEATTELLHDPVSTIEHHTEIESGIFAKIDDAEADLLLDSNAEQLLMSKLQARTIFREICRLHREARDRLSRGEEDAAATALEAAAATYQQMLDCVQIVLAESRSLLREHGHEVSAQVSESMDRAARRQALAMINDNHERRDQRIAEMSGLEQRPDHTDI